MVATPTLPGEASYDHSAVDSVLTNMTKHPELMKNKLVVIGCTVMPGYTQQANQILKSVGLTASYNPEFIAQGAIFKGLSAPDMVLIGEADAAAGDAIQAVYTKTCVGSPVVCRMDPLSAEITKISLNCFITMKISFANMIGDACLAAGAQTNRVLQAIGSDSRVGSKYLNYGFGYGGPCFPRDNRAFSHFAEAKGVDCSLSKATDQLNKAHTQFQIKSLAEENRTEYVFDGITYRENSPVPIIEESQKLVIAVELAKLGKNVIVKDTPEVLALVKKEYPGVPLTFVPK